MCVLTNYSNEINTVARSQCWNRCDQVINAVNSQGSCELRAAYLLFDTLLGCSLTDICFVSASRTGGSSGWTSGQIHLDWQLKNNWTLQQLLPLVFGVLWLPPHLSETL